MKFFNEELVFDIDNADWYFCDWCGSETWVCATHYGTTYYTRLICKECAERIKRLNGGNENE